MNYSIYSANIGNLMKLTFFLIFIMLVHIQRYTFECFCCVGQHIDWKQIGCFFLCPRQSSTMWRRMFCQCIWPFDLLLPLHVKQLVNVSQIPSWSHLYPRRCQWSPPVWSMHWSSKHRKKKGNQKPVLSSAQGALLFRLYASLILWTTKQT